MFITFEGVDGSGKTTQIRLLAQALRGRGYEVLLTREPGGTPIGDRIREVLHDLKHTEMHPHTEVLLYQASRAQLVAQVLRPALAAGQIILCDRFYDSTLAYQGYGHGLDLAGLRALIHFATGGLKPDLTVYLELSAAAGLARRQQAAATGGEEFNRMDAFALEFYERVRAGYESLIEAEPGRWLRVKAEQPIEALHQDIMALLSPKLPGA
jgi:dTMP kinase